MNWHDWYATTQRLFRAKRLAVGERKPVRQTALNSTSIALIEPKELQLALHSNGFYGNTGTSVAFQPVTAIPTTTATRFLYNTGLRQKSLCIHSIGIAFLSNTSTEANGTLFACVQRPNTEFPTLQTFAQGPIGSRVGRIRSRWDAAWVNAQTLSSSPKAPTWVQVCSMPNPAGGVATDSGIGMQNVRIEGGLVVPPKFGLGLAFVRNSSAGINLIVSVGWSETQFDQPMDIPHSQE